MGIMDVGRGSRRFALPSGHTIGEGWVNDPQQAYNFGRGGITPEDTGEYEGMAGEGVRGGRSAASFAPAMGGLRAAMGGGGDDDAPGASLMRRLTSSPDMAARYGLIGNPNATAGPSHRLPHEIDQDVNDSNFRRGHAMQALRAQLQPEEMRQADVESEAGARRHRLPEMAHLRQEDKDDLMAKITRQFLEPAQERAGADIFTAEAGLAGRQAQAGASEKAAAMKGLTDVMTGQYGAPTDTQRTRFNELAGAGQKGSISAAELDQIVKSGGLPGVSDVESARRVLLSQGYDVQDAPAPKPWYSRLFGGG